MFDYHFTPRAERDLLAARRWYNRLDINAGARFATAIDRAIQFVRHKPEALAPISRGIRAIRCRDFPYKIYYRFDGQIIVILAVYHASRDPDRWDDPHRK